MSDEFKIQFSYKFGPGGQDMLNVRGANAAEIQMTLADIAGRLQEALDLGSALRGDAAAAPTHDQAIATVQQAVPQATVAYDSAPAAAPNVTVAQAPAPQGGGAMYELTDKYNRVFTYNVPGAPATPRGPALMMKATSQKGVPYKKWVDPATGPEWFSQRKPKVEKHEQWEGEFIRG